MAPQRRSSADDGASAFGTVLFREEKLDDFDGFFDEPDDGGGGGNPRCLWDGSVCSDSVTHQITFRFFPDGDEPFLEQETYCGRHYAVVLAQFVSFHSPHCPITLGQHLDSFGAYGT